LHLAENEQICDGLDTTTPNMSKRLGDRIADISVGSAATNFYDILARQNPVMEIKDLK
jgi:hypothetical protein